MAVPGYFPVNYFPGLVQGGGSGPVPFIPVLSAVGGDTLQATYTTTGFPAPELVDVFRTKITGNAPLVWEQVSTGPINGNGTIVEATPAGIYLAYARGRTTDAASEAVTFAVSNGLAAVATRNRDALAALFALLPYPPAQRIYSQIIPDEDNIQFPCTILTVDGTQETNEQALSTVDDIGRPCKVILCDRGGRKDHAKLPLFELWREKYIRAVLNQRTPGLPESKINQVEYNVVIDPNLPAFEHIISAFIVRSICREPRGLGV
jgi:hypothetical protein